PSLGNTRSTIGAYSEGLVDAGLSRIPPRDSQLPNRSIYQGSVQENLTLLGSGRAVLNAISADNRVRDAAVPTLFYPDLHKRNIFVSHDDPSLPPQVLKEQSVPGFSLQSSHSLGRWMNAYFDPFSAATERGRMAPLLFGMSSLKPLKTGKHSDCPVRVHLSYRRQKRCLCTERSTNVLRQPRYCAHKIHIGHGIQCLVGQNVVFPTW
ncbi:hypothetical protein N7447_003672, partial [Penicillium robsamsonii]|uniref:uncharacterized protein n=1 Tax=Penicillium robsamsonii TaxID=1792511 RepID=UPI002547ED58